MANGMKLMDDIHEQFLVCKICFQLYDQPKTLLCLHTFCTGCLEQHLEAEMQRPYRYLLYARAVSCPLCRRKTDVPTGGIRRLPDNFLVASLTDVLSKRQPETAVCEICRPVEGQRPASRKAQLKCLECSKNLCKRCVQLHRNTRVTQAHTLFDISAEKDIACKVHPDEVVRFYCDPCEMCVCVLCTFHEHRTHDVSSLDEGTTKHRQSLDELISLCKDRIANVRHQLHMINKCESDMVQVEDHIRDMAIDSISTIRRKERDMLENLYSAYGEETISFLKEKAPLQESLKGMESTCNLTSIALKDQSLQLLLLKKDTEQKLQFLLQHKLQMPPDNISRQVKFIPGSLEFGTLDIDGELAAELDAIADSVEAENGSGVSCDSGAAILETQKAMREILQLAGEARIAGDMCNASGEVNHSATNNNINHTMAVKRFQGVSSRVQLTDQSTDTRYLIRSRNQETSMKAPILRSSSTTTEHTITLNKSTLTASVAVSPHILLTNGEVQLLDNTTKLVSGDIFDGKDLVDVLCQTSISLVGEIVLPNGCDDARLFSGEVKEFAKSPAVISLAERAVRADKADVIMHDASSSTSVRTCDVGILKRPQCVSRGTSVRQIKLSKKKSTSNAGLICERCQNDASSTQQDTTPAKLCVDRASSPVRAFLDVVVSRKKTCTRDFGTGMRIANFVNRESSPIRVAVTDGATMTEKATSLSRGTSTPVATQAHRGTQMKRIRLTDSSTGMKRICYIEKETSMQQATMINKNTHTDNMEMVDKQVSTMTDIAAKWKLLTEAAKRANNATKGTTSSSTASVAIKTNLPRTVTTPTPTTKSATVARVATVERACSPIRRSSFDKGVSVTLGELREPVDVFHTPEKITTKPMPSLLSELSSSQLSLSIIEEDSKESGSSDEDVRRLANSLKDGHHVNGLPLEQQFRSTSIKETESTFNVDGRSSPKCILWRIETGTNTPEVELETKGTCTPPPAEMEDKSMCTETVAVTGKMADCINKLRNVRQRLEQPASDDSSKQELPKYLETPVNTVDVNFTFSFDMTEEANVDHRPIGAAVGKNANDGVGVVAFERELKQTREENRGGASRPSDKNPFKGIQRPEPDDVSMHLSTRRREKMLDEGRHGKKPAVEQQQKPGQKKTTEPKLKERANSVKESQHQTSEQLHNEQLAPYQSPKQQPTPQLQTTSQRTKLARKQCLDMTSLLRSTLPAAVGPALGTTPTVSAPLEEASICAAATVYQHPTADMSDTESCCSQSESVFSQAESFYSETPSGSRRGSRGSDASPRRKLSQAGHRSVSPHAKHTSGLRKRFSRLKRTFSKNRGQPSS